MHIARTWSVTNRATVLFVMLFLHNLVHTCFYSLVGDSVVWWGTVYGYVVQSEFKLGNNEEKK